jgi:ABC-type sugar transport system ATPase subunit
MLQVRSLAKSYGETHALAGVDLDAGRGRILGVAGPNGAGKSTLVRILAGEETADAGSVSFDGIQLNASHVEVAVVHQEPQLFPNLTVGQNLLAAAEGTRWKWPRLTGEVVSVLGDMELASVAHRTLGTLPLAIQQRTEIARAILRDAPIVLFDEPNSALTEDESQRLFEWMHRVADRGAVVLFISHRLSELVEHSESVIVLRDGRVASLLSGSFTQEQIARALVSDVERDPSDRAMPANTGREVPIMRLKGWRSRRGRFSVPQLELHEGEVIAVVGVEGSGGREFVASLAGFEPVHGRDELAPGGRSVRSRGDTQYLPASRATKIGRAHV